MKTSAKDKLIRAWLTFFGAGLSPAAPGTVGSIAGAAVGYFLLIWLDFLSLILLGILIFIFSIKIIDEYEKTHQHDASEIVIDEVAGVFLAIGVAFAGADAQGLSVPSALDFSLAHWLIMLAALGAFRLFDIAKPSVIGRVDRSVPGGLGVMGDDVLAGVFAGIFVVVLHGIYISFKGYL